MSKKIAKFKRVAYHLGCYMYHTFMMYFYLAMIKLTMFKKRLKEVFDI